MPPKQALGAYRGTNLSALRSMAAAEIVTETTIPEEVDQRQSGRGHSSLVNDHRGVSGQGGGRSVRSERAEATYKINGEYVENPEDILAGYRKKEAPQPIPPVEEPPKHKSPRTPRRSETVRNIPVEDAGEMEGVWDQSYRQTPRRSETTVRNDPIDPQTTTAVVNNGADYPRQSERTSRRSERTSRRSEKEEEEDVQPVPLPSRSVRSARSARFVDDSLADTSLYHSEVHPVPVFERKPLTEPTEEHGTRRFMQSPRSPPMSGKIPVEEYEVKRTYTAASPSTKIPTTIEDVPPGRVPPSSRVQPSRGNGRDDQLESLNSKQLREMLRRLQEEKTSRRTRTTTPRLEDPIVSVKKKETPSRNNEIRETPMDEKIPMWDEDTKRWVLISKSKIEEMQQGFNHPRTATNATIPPPAEEGASGELDFDNMTPIQQREFNDEMRVKFNILRRGYPQFGIPEVTSEDDPRWLWGMYQQFLDMAKHESSVPFYRNGMTIFFFLTDALLTYLGIPCNGEFYKFHNSYAGDYNSLLIELGEAWGPVMDVSWRTETKLALMIGWNTLVFVVIKFITTKFGDRFAGVMESFVRNLNAKDFIQGNNESGILSKAKEKLSAETGNTAQGAEANPMGNVMGNLMNMLGGMMGGNGGGGNNKMMEGLLSGLGSMMTSQTDGGTRQRRKPEFDDI